MFSCFARYYTLCLRKSMSLNSLRKKIIKRCFIFSPLLKNASAPTPPGETENWKIMCCNLLCQQTYNALSLSCTWSQMNHPSFEKCLRFHFSAIATQWKRAHYPAVCSPICRSVNRCAIVVGATSSVRLLVQRKLSFSTLLLCW